MTYQIATLISCLLFPLFGFIGYRLAGRTVYRAIPMDDNAQRNEQDERDKVKKIREDGVRRTFTVYAVIVVLLFSLAFLAEPARKVRAALWPTATPTASNTATPSPTKTPTRTPTITVTPSITSTANANNFLTSLAGAGTLTPGTPRPGNTPQPGGGGGGVVIQTRIVSIPQTVVVVRTVIVTVVVIQGVPVTVVVTVTETSVHTPTVTATPSPTFTHTETATQTPIPSITPTVTATVTETPTP